MERRYFGTNKSRMTMSRDLDAVECDMTKSKFLSVFAVIALLASALSLPHWLGAQAVVQRKKDAPVEQDYSGKSLYWNELRRYVQDTHDVHIGMSRSELQKTHHMESGLTDGQTWCYNHCPFIRMKVTFKADSNNQPLFSFDPSDRVTALGKPYWDNQRESPN